MSATSHSQAPAGRDALPWLAAAALTVLAWLALGATSAHNAQIERMVEEELRGELRENVSKWELDLQAALDDALLDVRTSRDLVTTQDRLRRRLRWFDSAFVWTPPTGGALATPGDLLLPGATRNTLDGAAQACIRVTAEARNGSIDQIEAARSAGCRGQTLAVHLLATNEAARALREAGRRIEAFRLIDRIPAPDLGPFSAWRTDPILLQALVEGRLLRGSLAWEGGDEPGGLAILRSLVDDALSLEVQDLDRAMPSVQNALKLLADNGADTNSTRAHIHTAEARLEAWRFVQSLLIRPVSRASSEGPRFELHLIGEHPWAVYWLPPEADGRGVALLMQPQRLLEDFLRTESGRYRSALVVRDPAHRVIGGAMNAADAPETTVSFAVALAHSTVAFTRDYSDARTSPLLDAWWTARNIVTAVCIVLGFGALLMISRAEKQHRELLQRQREFTTRVTHELKTPLAGMKVMAENLAAGAFRDERQAKTMAARIVQEADRLTARVNEVLQATRKREVPPMEPVDLEEILLEAIDEWGPRYEQANIRLQADMEPLDPVLGEPRALRDAFNCLLDNALKYRREDVESEVWLNARTVSTNAEIEVIDNGLGVPFEQRGRIFDRFARVEGNNRGRSGGHGLGLAQVAEIVSDHKGTVRCEDGVDGGARFVVLLPLIP
jgi:signal transduction histidine kinase